MNRQQLPSILRDLAKKMVFLVGPRQVGKTWLAKEVAKQYTHSLYLNYDQIEDKKIILAQSWLPTTTLLILDELHKMSNWKQYLKGLFDTKTPHLHILVTGSARLDTFRQAGDSLAGRFFIHHLLPFSPSELANTPYNPSLERLITRGGFPEPFLADTDEDANRWRLHYTDSLLREDILNFDKIQDLKAMHLLIELLRNRVGSPLSYTSLAQDIHTSVNTVRKYIQILENLYIIFRITPFSKNIARSLVKEPKLYFFDTGMVKGNPGICYENAVAIALLKHTHLQRDLHGKPQELHYLKTKEGHEVDFAITEESGILHLIEAKYKDSTLSKPLQFFQTHYTPKNTLQLVYLLKRECHLNNITVRRAEAYLAELTP